MLPAFLNDDVPETPIQPKFKKFRYFILLLISTIIIIMIEMIILYLMILIGRPLHNLFYPSPSIEPRSDMIGLILSFIFFIYLFKFFCSWYELLNNINNPTTLIIFKEIIYLIFKSILLYIGLVFPLSLFLHFVKFNPGLQITQNQPFYINDIGSIFRFSLIAFYNLNVIISLPSKLIKMVIPIIIDSNQFIRFLKSKLLHQSFKTLFYSIIFPMIYSTVGVIVIPFLIISFFIGQSSQWFPYAHRYGYLIYFLLFRVLPLLTIDFFTFLKSKVRQLYRERWVLGHQLLNAE